VGWVTNRGFHFCERDPSPPSHTEGVPSLTRAVSREEDGSRGGGRIGFPGTLEPYLPESLIYGGTGAVRLCEREARGLFHVFIIPTRLESITPPEGSPLPPRGRGGGLDPPVGYLFLHESIIPTRLESITLQSESPVIHRQVIHRFIHRRTCVRLVIFSHCGASGHRCNRL